MIDKNKKKGTAKKKPTTKKLTPAGLKGGSRRDKRRASMGAMRQGLTVAQLKANKKNKK